MSETADSTPIALTVFVKYVVEAETTQQAIAKAVARLDDPDEVRVALTDESKTLAGFYRSVAWRDEVRWAMKRAASGLEGGRSTEKVMEERPDLCPTCFAVRSDPGARNPLVAACRDPWHARVAAGLEGDTE